MIEEIKYDVITDRTDNSYYSILNSNSIAVFNGMEIKRYSIINGRKKSIC